MNGKTKNYRKTLFACYAGFVTQAITANFAPLLFLKFHNDYSIPLGKIALIPAVFFLTQLVVDLFCAKFVDFIGYRKSVVASCICSAAGLVLLAFLPDFFSNPFWGINLCVMVYAIGSGLVEVLVSPIVEACPFENKEAVMSLLHSFYCWGSVFVILFSSLFFRFFGIENWRILACLWAVIPLVNIWNFATCPIESLVDDGKGLKIGELFKTPFFWVAVILMICAGASELSMSQWASAFAESAAGLSKKTGDLVGPCLFAVTMGTSRAFYGKFGGKINLTDFMFCSGIMCLGCYLAAAIFSNPVFSLCGCIFCGFSVGIMWPGTISICSKRIPSGGTAMFALLAMAGDLGGALGPSIVGNVTQYFNDNLKVGMAFGCIFPAVLIACLLLFHKKGDRQNKK